MKFKWYVLIAEVAAAARLKVTAELTQFDVLIVRQKQDYVRLPLSGLLIRQIGGVRLGVVIVVAIVIRLVKGTATLTAVRVVRRGVRVRSPGIDAQQ